MRERMLKERTRQGALILAWGLYDLANQFFVLNIVSLYFVRWVTIEKGVPEIFYSIAFGASMFLVAITAPVLGAISDILKKRMPFLIFLTLLSVIFTMILGFSENVLLSLLFFAVANFGCQAAVVFYNALLINIAPKERIGLVSGIGRMFGYSGALLALYLIKPLVLKGGYRAAFFPTGFLFLLFCLPCLILIKDKNQTGSKPASGRLCGQQRGLPSFLKKERILEVFGALKTFILESKNFPGLLNFLKATFFALCAVNVIIVFMSVYATTAFKLSESQIIHLIGFSTLFAIFGSIASGYISDRLGARNSILAIFILWIFCFVFAALARNVLYYWFVGSIVGFTLGSTWVVLRVLAIQLVPPQKIGEVFGIFNLAGYLSSVIGVLFWGLLRLLLAPLGEAGYRIALLSLSIFLVLGIVFLLRVPQIKTVKNA